MVNARSLFLSKNGTEPVLGQGGMGVVFLAEDAKLHRKIAIKAMLRLKDLTKE